MFTKTLNRGLYNNQARLGFTSGFTLHIFLSYTPKYQILVQCWW